MEGKVKWYNVKKGFGFIQGEDGQDYFVHHTGIKQGARLNENTEVVFDPVETEKGRQAREISLKGKQEQTGQEHQKRKPKEEYSQPEDEPADDEGSDTADFGEEEY